MSFSLTSNVRSVRLETCNAQAGFHNQWRLHNDTHELRLMQPNAVGEMQCLALEEWGTWDGAYLWLTGCHDVDYFLHTLDEWRTDGTALVNSASQRCLTAVTDTQSSELRVRDCNASLPLQAWEIDETTQQVRLSSTSLCLTVQDVLTCGDASLSNLPFCDATRGSLARAKDLVSRLTLEEKLTLLGTSQPSVPRLGVSAYQWWSECLHGVAQCPGVLFGGNVSYATVFPQTIGVAASFDMDLVRSMAEIVSTEARAFNNEQRGGLTFFTPNLNLFRDPRWGRGQETPGEDPWLAKEYTVNLVRGLQEGEDKTHAKTVATCKHFAAYDMEEWGGATRYNFDAVVSQQDLAETYLPVFEACVKEGGGLSVMCSYNAINGVPACANSWLQEDVLRTEWGFDGYVVTDCGALTNILEDHNYTQSGEDTVRVAMDAGTDLDCPGGSYLWYTDGALQDGLIQEQQVDQALERNFRSRFLLGDFDAVEEQPYRSITARDVDTPHAREVALQAARQSLVLLENNHDVLPLSSSLSSLAVIGPNADDPVTLLGNYHGRPPFIITPLAGLQALGDDMDIEVAYAKGCDVLEDASQPDIDEAVQLSAWADATVLVLGLNQTVEAEGLDRESILLPAGQQRLLDEVEKARKGPLVVVLVSGSSLDVHLESHHTFPGNAALVWAGYGGQAGGAAIADVLFGRFNPSGRLPVSFYRNAFTKNNFLDMDMRAGEGHTYRFHRGYSVTYPFGAGLSYSTVKYEWVDGNALVNEVVFDDPDETFNHTFALRVTNTNGAAVDHTVLAFVSVSTNAWQPVLGDRGYYPPVKELFHFQRVHLAPGESTDVSFVLRQRHLQLTSKTGERVMVTGDCTVRVGLQDSRFPPYVHHSFQLKRVRDWTMVWVGIGTAAGVMLVAVIFLVYHLRRQKRHPPQLQAQQHHHHRPAPMPQPADAQPLAAPPSTSDIDAYDSLSQSLLGDEHERQSHE